MNSQKQLNFADPNSPAVTDAVIRNLERLWNYPDSRWENSSASPLKRPRRFIREALRDLVASAQVSHRLFMTRIAQRYRYSSLGLLWAFAPSAIISAAVTVGHRARISALSHSDVAIQFYAIFGLILLQTFLEAFNTHRLLFTVNQQLLARHRIFLEAAFLAGLADNFFSLLVKLPLLVCAFFLCAVHPASTLILGVILMFVIVLLGAAFGLTMAPWNALKGDLNHVMSFLPWLLFATTPVFAEPDRHSYLWSLCQLNPLTWIFGAVRHLTYGSATAFDIKVVTAVFVTVLVVLPISWLICRIARPYMAELTLH